MRRRSVSVSPSARRDVGGGGLERERVEPREAVGEGEPRTAGEDAHAVEDRALEVEVHVADEIGERFESDFAAQRRAEFAFGRARVREEQARIDRIAAQAAHHAVVGQCVVEADVRAEAPRGAGERRGEREVVAATDAAQRTLVLAAQRKARERLRQRGERDGQRLRVEVPAQRRLGVPAQARAADEARRRRLAVHVRDVGIPHAEVAPGGVEDGAAAEDAVELRQRRLPGLRGAEVEARDVHGDSTEDRYGRLGDVDGAAGAGARGGARHVAVVERRGGVVDDEGRERAAAGTQSPDEASGQRDGQRSAIESLDERRVERCHLEVHVAQRDVAALHAPGHLPRKARGVRAHVHLRDDVLDETRVAWIVADVEPHPAAALGGDGRVDPGDVGQRDGIAVDAEGILRRAPAAPGDAAGGAAGRAGQREAFELGSQRVAQDLAVDAVDVFRPPVNPGVDPGARELGAQRVAQDAHVADEAAERERRVALVDVEACDLKMDADGVGVGEPAARQIERDVLPAPGARHAPLRR
ncbi:MAG TPA: hypothetical protein PK788_10225, partial [Gemmatimonadaceae bacterium]|nr:hypothetical protein [Gemmatimonadaceae bacterium]